HRVMWYESNDPGVPSRFGPFLSVTVYLFSDTRRTNGCTIPVQEKDTGAGRKPWQQRQESDGVGTRRRNKNAEGDYFMYRKTPLASAVSNALASTAFGVSPLVFAQDEDQAETQEIEEVVVTGSRNRRDVFSSSQPMDVVLTERATVQGFGDIGGLLQSTTVAAGSPQVTAATSTAFVQNGGIGAATLSLRGLGANRTLTLLNGRRAGPAGTRGAVSSFDLNVLPLVAVE